MKNSRTFGMLLGLMLVAGIFLLGVQTEASAAKGDTRVKFSGVGAAGEKIKLTTCQGTYDTPTGDNLGFSVAAKGSGAVTVLFPEGTIDSSIEASCNAEDPNLTHGEISVTFADKGPTRVSVTFQ